MTRAARDNQRADAGAAWLQREEAGHAAGLRIVELVAWLCGRRIVHLFVWPISAYFLLVRSAERRASREFLSQVLGRPARLMDSLRHFHTFACVAADRLFLLSGQRGAIPLSVQGGELMEQALAAGRGCILLSAHLGSFEAARQAGLADPRLRLRLLLDRTVNHRLIERLERIDPAFSAGILDASGDPQLLTLRLGECLQAGEWIGWLGDRHRGQERTVEVDFLGRPARLPSSPFIVAWLFKVPVFMVLACFDGRGYRITVEQLVDTGTQTGARDEFVQGGVRRFAAVLERQAVAWPCNWFNFYDFWQA